ncbi:MAG: hypothetical protein LC798_03850 [Chloroflexi bacterium]|nr:hypothetical protein [Chloroflexota bacterium]
MTGRSNVPALAAGTAELDAAIAAAEGSAIVVWRGERIPFADLPAHIARTDERSEREGLYAGWIEALEALNPSYRRRYEAGRERAAARMPDAEGLALELEQLIILSETVYYAALRRYLALIGIEQGDATLADLWHVERGSAWSHWFDERDLDRAAGEAGRGITGITHGNGWRSGASALGGSESVTHGPSAAVGELFRSLVGDPSWLGRALRMATDEIATFSDFVAFIRLWRLRRCVAQLQYEMRLYANDDESVQRAYYSGIVGHTTGVSVPEAAYLHAAGTPFSSVADLERVMLAAAMAERLESHYGAEWWAKNDARALTDGLANASSTEDALAQLGYDALDWRPVLRQIRTRLIGEMSGYGGPNITTRAGTRKV